MPLSPGPSESAFALLEIAFRGVNNSFLTPSSELRRRLFPSVVYHMWLTEWDFWPLHACFRDKEQMRMFHLSTGCPVATFLSLSAVMNAIFSCYHLYKMNPLTMVIYKKKHLADLLSYDSRCFHLFCRSRRRRFLGREREKEMWHKKYHVNRSSSCM